MNLRRWVCALTNRYEPTRGQQLLRVLKIVHEVQPKDLALAVLLGAKIPAAVDGRLLSLTASRSYLIRRTSFFSILSAPTNALMVIGLKIKSGSLKKPAGSSTQIPAVGGNPGGS